MLNRVVREGLGPLRLLVAFVVSAQSVSAEERAVAITDNPFGRVVIETNSLRPRGPGYVAAWFFVYTPKGRFSLSVVVQGCGSEQGRIGASLRADDKEAREWHTGGTGIYERMAQAVCAHRKAI